MNVAKASDYKMGDTVKFVVPMFDRRVRVEVGEIGVVCDAPTTTFELVPVQARGVRWVCRPWEIEIVKIGG